MAKETPGYDDFAEKLKTLKQHFSYDKNRVKIVVDPPVFAKKVDRHNAELHQMVEDMQSRIAKFRVGMSKAKTEVKD